MNSVTISGFIGKEVTLSKLESGVSVSNNALCVRNSPDSEKFTWITIIAYDKMAEMFAANFQQNDFVEILGFLKTRYWFKNGDKHYITEVVILRIASIDELYEKGFSEEREA